MDAKEDIRAKLSIEDVVGEYVQLKRAGRNWKGLSPFSAERTPSFIVSPEKGIWHDFSSGRGGDVFSFIQEIEGVDFKGAMEILARRAGIDLEQYKQVKGQSTQNKERLYEILELAAKFYQTQFAASKTALQYTLGKRQFSKQTALKWQLGYAPNNGTALVEFLRKKGFKDTEMKLAGLTSQNYRGNVQDMFRGRLMIPLADAQGRIVGFTARILIEDPNAPKYINTPSTPLYDKSRHVFGLHLAKDAIRKNKFVVLAEGNLDVIQSHQSGVCQVVATAGTALTEPHLKALSRLTGDIRLCFDADKAGVAATERAIPVASKAKVSLSIITIPSGKDPDELIKQDVKIWKEIIDKPLYAVDWLIDRYTSQLDIHTALGKRTLSDVVLGVIKQLPDSVEQDHYMGRLADLLQVNKAALQTKLMSVNDETKPRQYRQPLNKYQIPDKQLEERRRHEENFMALTLIQPRFRSKLYNLTSDMFTNPNARQAFEFLSEFPDFDGTDKDQVQKIAEYGKILSLVYETLYQDVEAIDLDAEVDRLHKGLVSQYVRTQKQSIVAELQTAEPKKADELLKKARELDELLRLI